MKIIHIETVSAKPHLEISGEIAMRQKNKNKNIVKFVYLEKNLLWHDWKLPFIFQFLKFLKINRIQNFKAILKKSGIEILNEDNYDNFEKESILNWSKTFEGSINDLYKKKYKNINVGKGVASSLISFYRDLNLDTKKYKSKIQKMLFNAAVILRRTEMLIKLEKPDQIVTFNGRFSITYPIVALSKKFQLKVLQHDRGSNFDMYETFENDIHNARYRYSLIKQHWKKSKVNKKRIGKLYFIQRRKKKKMGNDFGFDFTSRQKKNYLNFKKTKKILIVYYTSTDYETAAVLNDTNQLKKFNFFYKIVSKLDYVDLIIRVHPDIKNKNFKEDDKWKKYSSKSCTVIQSDDKTDSYKLLERADIIVGYNSSILIEAVYWKKKVFTLDDNNIYYYSGVVKLIKNKRDLLDIFSKSFKFKKTDLNICLSIGYYFKTYGKKFKYYKPSSFFDGKFLNKNLEWKSKIVIFLEKIGLNFIYYYFKDRKYK